tara:strand:+ start:122 stop:592 length:471 start_codon:yes stop_codon:yes gene_type:complete
LIVKTNYCFNKALIQGFYLIQDNEILEIKTMGKGLTEITSELKLILNRSNICDGIMNISILHTSASILIQENADSTVQKDLKDFFDKICPEHNDYYHNSEGSDDMPAHLKSSLLQTNLSLSIIDKKLILGTWQGIYLFEHRVSRKNRKVLVHLMGS